MKTNLFSTVYRNEVKDLKLQFTHFE